MTCWISLLLLFIGLLQSKNGFAITENKDEKCKFQNTVNLTNLQSYENGSYLYQDLLIPPENQSFYDYDVKFQGAMYAVPTHLRGCVCDKRPCIKLCCKTDEYFNDMPKKRKCEPLTGDMNIDWDLSVTLADDAMKVANALKHFTIQVGLPCWNPEPLNETLDSFLLLEDGSIFVGATGSVLGTLDYCYSFRYYGNYQKYLLTPYSCPVKNQTTWRMLLTTYAMAVSVVFLIPTIIVYLMLKELRGNLRGKLLICYLVSVTIGYAIISFINISTISFSFFVCSLLGFTCYFFFMAAFLWLSVLCFDIWLNFKETNVELNSHKNQNQFIIYSLYAWLSAALATGFLIYLQFSPNIEYIYKPGIGTEMCWLNTNKWSAAIYFYGPNLIILLFNFATFAHLTARIYYVRRDLARMTHKEKFFQESAIVILRLFLIMGISWLFDIMSYCVRNYEKWDFLFLLSDFANAIQGLLIFSLFVLKPNVLLLLKKKFQRQQPGRPRRSTTTSATNFSKLQTSASVTHYVPAITP